MYRWIDAYDGKTRRKIPLNICRFNHINEDKALECLHENNYDVEKALDCIKSVLEGDINIITTSASTSIKSSQGMYVYVFMNICIYLYI
jgi:hypothetical protein